MNGNYGRSEVNLPKVTTFEWVRVLKDGASRIINKVNFVSDIASDLISYGFLTTASLPVSVSQIRPYREIVAGTTLLITDSVLGVDSTSGNIGVNLLLASEAYNTTTLAGQSFTIKNVSSDANKVTISSSGSDLIDGYASIELDSTDQPFITIMAISNNRWILV